MSQVRELLQEKIHSIEKWEQEIGLDNDHLYLTLEQIRELSSEEKGEIAAELASLSITLQREYNKCFSLANFLDSLAKSYTANDLQNFEGYYSADQRQAVATANNDNAREADRLRMHAKLKCDRLQQIPFQINQLLKYLHPNSNNYVR